MKLPLSLIVIAAAAARAAAADDACNDGWLCIDEIRDSDNVELVARNLRDVPITYTLSIRSRNYSVSGPNTVTRTVEPLATQSIMLLDHREGGGKGFYKYSLKWTVGRQDADHDDDYIYDLPYASGNSYRVLQGYGSRFSHTGHEQYAVDFDMREGTPVHAAREGVIARVEESHTKGCWEDGCGRYANFIVILHDDGTTGEYYHLQQHGALVEPGERVKRGQQIGHSGNTGHTTMPHLHFAVYRAIDWGRTQSVPVRFRSADGIIERPRRGGRYQAR